MPDPYLIPGTVVLQNKLGISDFDELEQAVADIGDAMAYRLFDKNTPVPATLAGWRAVHKAMFGSVFKWAGDFRKVNIRKSGDDDSSDGFFAPYGRLVADRQRAVRNLENTVRRIQTAKISLQAQIQSGIVFGATAALYGEITLRKGRVEQTNFDTYQMLRMNEAPAIEVHVVKSAEPPGGMDEIGTSAIVPAIANAIFAATGKRLRKMPVDASALKQPV